MHAITKFLVGRLAEDEKRGDEPWPGELNSRRHPVLKCQDNLDTGTGAPEAYERALRQFASHYAEHPDYRPEWTPLAYAHRRRQMHLANPSEDVARRL
jgi:hypothetical protein